MYIGIVIIDKKKRGGQITTYSRSIIYAREGGGLACAVAAVRGGGSPGRSGAACFANGRL